MKKIYNILLTILVCGLMMGIRPASARDISIHGFISQGYLKTDQNNYLADTDKGSFQFNEMGLNFTTYVLKDLKVGMQFFARDLGAVGNDEVTLNWAFAEYTFKNWLGLRAGLIKIPFGFYNDTRDFDSLRTSIFLPSGVYNEWQRDGLNSMKGAELFGALDMAAGGVLEYQLQIGQSQIPLDSGSARFVTEVNGGFENLTRIDLGIGYIARLIWTTPLDGLRLGASYLLADNEWDATRVISDTAKYPMTLDSTFTYIIGSMEYVFRNFTLAAEIYRQERDADAYVTVPGVGVMTLDQDLLTKDIFYVRGGYRFTDWFEAGYYYSEYFGNKDSHLIKDELKDHCLSLRFDINYNWIAKAEVHKMNGEFGVEADDDGHKYSEWMLYALKISYSF